MNNARRTPERLRESHRAHRRNLAEVSAAANQLTMDELTDILHSIENTIPQGADFTTELIRKAAADKVRNEVLSQSKVPAFTYVLAEILADFRLPSNFSVTFLHALDERERLRRGAVPA